MDPFSYRCCCPRLHSLHRRQNRILFALKSQSRHHLAFEINRFLLCMPSRFLHFLRRILEILGRLDKVGFEFEDIAAYNSTKESAYTPSLGNTLT
ncbi:uncharacterized protein TNCV_2327771 [Trichonephila clavipes]|nr:uncharacterized protein TNCV_2327771 [Trichonephila clavipes]